MVQPRSATSSQSRTRTKKALISVLVIVTVVTALFLNETEDSESLLLLSGLIHTDEKQDTTNRRTPRKSPHRVYTCGYDNLFPPDHDQNLAVALFPEVKPPHHIHLNWTTTMTNNNNPIHNNASVDRSSGSGGRGVVSFQENDVLLWPCGGDCPIPPDQLTSAFPGIILTINGESSPSKCTLGPDPLSSRVYPLDTISRTPTEHTNATSFATGIDLASRPARLRQSIYDPLQRNFNTGERFLIYIASNCGVPYRDKAFALFSKISRRHPEDEVYYGGRCHAGGVGTRHENSQDLSWLENPRIMHMYRFALVLENANVDGYMTEKILNAFLAGTIPIYYGTTQVFDVFNKNAFIYYDIENPQPALDRVAYLEKNRTAYLQMLQQEPILAHGERTIARYFSLRDSEGGGRLKWAIRDQIGFG